MRLHGAQGKKQIWHPHVWPKMFQKQMHCIEESTVVTCRDLSTLPTVIQHTKCAPLPP